MKELFKIIHDYPTYEVSTKGRIRNIKFRRFLKLQFEYTKANAKGHRYKSAVRVGLTKNKVQRKFHVHFLMAVSFDLPKPKSKRTLTIDHINRNAFDNRLENLRWVTPREQVNNRSAKKCAVKITMKQLNKIYKETKTKSFSELEKFYKIDAATINKLLMYMHPLY
jgi:HNH endonuclease